MFEVSRVQCPQRHPLPSPHNSGNQTNRPGIIPDTKFYPTPNFILMTNPQMVNVNYLGISEEKVNLTIQQPLNSVAICEEANLICTCSEDEIVLWRMDPILKTWTRKIIGVEIGRVSTSALCSKGQNIFVSLDRGSEIIVIHCVAHSNPNEGWLQDIQLFAPSDKTLKPNAWLHNFILGEKLHVIGFSSGGGVVLQIWECGKEMTKLKHRFALQMKTFVSADFMTRGQDSFIAAISGEGHCELFAIVNQEFGLLGRFRVDESSLAFNSVSDLNVQFRICCARFFSPNLKSSVNENAEKLTFPNLFISLATSTSICIVNPLSGHVEVNVDYEDLLQEKSVISSAKLSMGESGQIILAYQPILQNYVATMRIEILQRGDEVGGNEEGLSLISTEPPGAKSVLRKKLKSPRTSPEGKGRKKRNSIGIKTPTKPIVPSGFTFPPRGELKTKKIDQIPKIEYSLDELNFGKSEGRLESPLSPGQTTLKLSMSSDGKLMTIGGNISPLVVFKLKPKLEPISILKAVEKLSSVDFSFDSKHLITTSSTSSTTIVNWKTGKEELSFNFISKFNEHIYAQFYFMDKFIIQPQDNRIVFYSFRIQEPKCALVAGSFLMDCQKITAMAAPNQFYSNLIICGLSNKCIQIWDASVERVASTITNSHSKSPNCIRINEAPMGEGRICDFFLTSTNSPFDPVKLWDLRANRCVSRIGDVNPKGFVPNSKPALSPCGRYIASGYEENIVSIYDVRKIKSRVKKMKNTGIILDSNFDRNFPILWSAGSDGKVWWFRA